MLLALASAAVTLPVLSWTLTALERVVPVRWDVDLRVVGFAVLVSFASVLVFGLAPALRLSAARGGAATGFLRVGEMPRKSRTRQVLVAVQVALSLGLLATGSQLISAVRHMSGVTGAIDPSRLLMVSFDLSQLNAPEVRANTFYQRLLERVERLPGVQGAGLAAEDAMWTFGTGMGDDNSLVLWPPGEPPSRGRLALGGYTGGPLIETIGLGLRPAGSLLRPMGGAPRVAIVNRSANTQFFGGAAVGRRIRVAPRNSTYEMSQEVEIVGVVEPALDPNYVKDPADPTVPAVYLPERLEHQPALTLYVRTREAAASLVPAIQQAAASVDPLVPVLRTGTLAERRFNRQLEERLTAQAVTLLGVLGLALASGGLYGMVSFIVALKRREIGVRMALGARPRAILQLMLAQGMTTALTGATIGGAIALALSVVLRAQVFRVRRSMSPRS